MDTNTGEILMAETMADLRASMASLTTKVDMVLQRMDPQLSDHEMRIRKLEQFRWSLVGAALAGGGVAGTIASHFLG